MQQTALRAADAERQVALMRTHVEFRSSAFPRQVGEEDQVNPGRWGKALADYLRAEFTKRGLGAGEPYPEDWGWAVPIENDGFPLWVGCANYEEFADGFLCFIEPSKPTIRKLFSTIDTTSRVGQVADALHSALSAHDGVRDLLWWSNHETAT